MMKASFIILVLFCVNGTIGTTEKCFSKSQLLLKGVQGREGHCEQLCDRIPQCTHYLAESFVSLLGTLENCHLLKGNVSWSDAKPAANSSSMEFKFVKDIVNSWSDAIVNTWSAKPTKSKTTCGIKNTWRKIGEDYMGTNCLFEIKPYQAYPLETGDDCFQLCKDHSSHCNHFNFIKDGQQDGHCHLMQGIHKGMKDTTLVTPKVHQSISCGYLKDN